MSTESRNLIIEAKNLKKNYGPVKALREASFTVREGEIIALLGPNGAGKTTIMKILTGFLEPSSGEVKIDGLSVETNRLEVQSRIGYLPENAPIYGDMLVQDYLLFAGRLRGLPDAELLERIAEAVTNTGLQDVLVRPIGELSKGFRQRVGLAQAILHRPKLLILDEPTNGLDPTQIVEMRGLIKRLAKHATVMLSTHILSEAEATCDRAIMIIQGEVKADARLSELSQSSEVLLSIVDAGVGKDAQIIAALQKITGVAKVEHQADGRYRIYGSNQGVSSHDLALQVFKKVKTEGWDLNELKPEVRTLEAVFRELALQSFPTSTEVSL